MSSPTDFSSLIQAVVPTPAPAPIPVPQRQFTCFNKLPAELRDMVWDRALDGCCEDWRVVYVHYDAAFNYPAVNRPRLEPDAADSSAVALACKEAAKRWRNAYHIPAVPTARDVDTVRLDRAKVVFLFDRQFDLAYQAQIGSARRPLFAYSPQQGENIFRAYLRCLVHARHFAFIEGKNDDGCEQLTPLQDDGPFSLSRLETAHKIRCHVDVPREEIIEALLWALRTPKYGPRMRPTSKGLVWLRDLLHKSPE